MKNIFIALCISIIFLAGIGRIHAAVSPTTSPTTVDEQLNQDLQARIASEVAQKNLVEKKGFIGAVVSVSGTQITVQDNMGNQRIIDVDELTNFSSPSAKSSFGISDITKGTTIGVVGLYNKDSRHLLARWVDVLVEPVILTGGILSVDTSAYTFSMATLDNPSITIDVENITKTTSYTSTGGVVKSGFSHIAAGQRVLVGGFPDVNNKNLIIASRIIVFPNLPPNPKIPLVKPEDIAPVTPSTGSGKKLTPIR